MCIYVIVYQCTILNTSSDNLVDVENQTALDEVSTWCSLNRLSTNIKKTKHMTEPSNREDCYDLDFYCRVEVNGERLKNVHSYNYLGVVTYDLLSFTDLVDHM